MCGRVLCVMLCLAAANASQVRGALRAKAEGFVKAFEFKRKLRVCNAYPYTAPLDVFRGKNERLTRDDPLPYKTCRDMLTPLKPGDKLEFKVGDASAGTFSVNDLPNNDAILLLVIHRHDTLSSAVSFESHIFANLLNAQVAIIDTFKGKAKGTPRIMDAEGNSRSPRSEELRYNSVVAVNPGTYEVALQGEDGETKAKSELVALERESYVVLRTGVEAAQGESYDQSLVVFPNSDVKRLQKPAMALPSGAQHHALPSLVACLGLVLAVAASTSVA